MKSGCYAGVATRWPFAFGAYILAIKKCKHYVSSSAKAGYGLCVLWRAHEAVQGRLDGDDYRVAAAKAILAPVLHARRAFSNPALATETSSKLAGNAQDQGSGSSTHHRFCTQKVRS